MKFTFVFLVILFFASIGFSQSNSITIQTEAIASSKTVKVKFKNTSFKSYKIYIPDVIEIESVKFGTNTFCLQIGQEIYFVHEGQNHLLQTAKPEDNNQTYNLPKLIKKRKIELGLK